MSVDNNLKEITKKPKIRVFTGVLVMEFQGTNLEGDALDVTLQKV
jgi:hypothetical protein